MREEKKRDPAKEMGKREAGGGGGEIGQVSDSERLF